MKKYWIGMALCLGVTTAMAGGLSLQSTGITSPIKVSCNGTPLTSVELQPNSTVSNLPWWLISVAFGSASTLNCQFMLDNSGNDLVGTATLEINSSDTQAEAMNIQPVAGYHVTVTPGANVFSSDITVALQQST